jgi:hypothetical protein
MSQVAPTFPGLALWLTHWPDKALAMVIAEVVWRVLATAGHARWRVWASPLGCPIPEM